MSEIGVPVDIVFLLLRLWGLVSYWVGKHSDD